MMPLGVCFLCECMVSLFHKAFECYVSISLQTMIFFSAFSAARSVFCFNIFYCFNYITHCS